MVNGGPILKASPEESDRVEDLLPIAIEAQELPIEKIDNFEVNVGKMFDRSIGGHSLHELVHGWQESVNHKFKPLLDQLGHFRLSEIIKHLKNKPILSHVVGDERPTTIEVVVHKPNGHVETIFSIPHKKFLHKFSKPEEEHHEETEEHQESESNYGYTGYDEGQTEGQELQMENLSDVKLKPITGYKPHVYATTLKKPVAVGQERTSDIDSESFYDDFENPIYKPSKRERRDITTIHYPEEYEEFPNEDLPSVTGVKGPQRRPQIELNKVPEGEKETEFSTSDLGGVTPGKGTTSEQQEAVDQKPRPVGVEGPVKAPSNELDGGLPTLTRRPDKFVVTIEQHPTNFVEPTTLIPEEVPTNVDNQDEFTAQELLQLAYKWLRRNVIFRI
ncbi:hypothetical protein DMENIID0001_103120 [Sergentomyia squamirostris]